MHFIKENMYVHEILWYCRKKIKLVTHREMEKGKPMQYTIIEKEEDGNLSNERLKLKLHTGATKGVVWQVGRTTGDRGSCPAEVTVCGDVLPLTCAVLE